MSFDIRGAPTIHETIFNIANETRRNETTKKNRGRIHSVFPSLPSGDAHTLCAAQRSSLQQLMLLHSSVHDTVDADGYPDGDCGALGSLESAASASAIPVNPIRHTPQWIHDCIYQLAWRVDAAFQVCYDHRLQGRTANSPHNVADSETDSRSEAAAPLSCSALPYWTSGGTTLGILRHDGHLIPWDDDMDLCMWQEDGEWLLEQLRSGDEWYAAAQGHHHRQGRPPEDWDDGIGEKQNVADEFQPSVTTTTPPLAWQVFVRLGLHVEIVPSFGFRIVHRRHSASLLRNDHPCADVLPCRSNDDDEGSSFSVSPVWLRLGCDDCEAAKDQRSAREAVTWCHEQRWGKKGEPLRHRSVLISMGPDHPSEEDSGTSAIRRCRRFPFCDVFFVAVRKVRTPTEEEPKGKAVATIVAALSVEAARHRWPGEWYLLSNVPFPRCRPLRDVKGEKAIAAAVASLEKQRGSNTSGWKSLAIPAEPATRRRFGPNRRSLLFANASGQPVIAVVETDENTVAAHTGATEPVDTDYLSSWARHLLLERWPPIQRRYAAVPSPVGSQAASPLQDGVILHALLGDDEHDDDDPDDGDVSGGGLSRPSTLVVPGNSMQYVMRMYGADCFEVARSHAYDHQTQELRQSEVVPLEDALARPAL